MRRKFNRRIGLFSGKIAATGFSLKIEFKETVVM